MNNNNLNVNDLMKMLSKMDKEQLEKGLNQASKILNNPKADNIINEIRNSNNSNNQ